MTRRGHVLLLALAAVALTGAARKPAHRAAVDTQHFDLICTGAKADSSGGERWTGRVAIDLARKLAHWDRDPANTEITSATPGRITFRQEFGHSEIDRTSGEFARRWGFAGSSFEWTGHCERAPFSGVVEPQF